MKKAISLFLACIMLLACAPVTVFALETEWSGAVTKDTSETIGEGNTVKVTGTVTLSNVLSIASGAELNIENGATLTVSGSNGRIVNSGKINVKNGGRLYIAGASGQQEMTAAALYNNAGAVINVENTADMTIAKGSYAYNEGGINNIDNVTVSGELKHLVTLPGDFKEDYKYTETWNRKDLTVDFDVKYFMYGPGSKDLDYLDETLYSDATDNKVWVDNGNQLFILISPEDGDGDWVDTGRMKINVNGQLAGAKDRIGNDRGVFCITPTSAVNIEVHSKKYKDIVRLFEVELPRSEAYYVITKAGDEDTAIVEYGKTLSFMVRLNDEYDKSDIYVYINSVYVEPDEYGYYDVTGPISSKGMATEGGVQEDIIITILGAAPNQRIDMMNSIVGFIQEIFSVIKSIFEYFIDIFSSLGDLGGLGG